MIRTNTAVTWTQVNLKTIESNARFFVDKVASTAIYKADKQRITSMRPTTARVMAVVKADAYGHGAIACAKAALRGGVSKFAVARVDEAIDFRDNWNKEFDIYSLSSSSSKSEQSKSLENLSSNNYFSSSSSATAATTVTPVPPPPLLLLGYALPAQIDAMIERDVTLTVWSEEQLRSIVEAARRCKRVANIHIKLNTGMNRVGVDSLYDLLRLLRLQDANSDLVRWTGLYTHFACADDKDHTSMLSQRDDFDGYLTEMDISSTANLEVETHCSNSAATLAIGNSFRTDMVLNFF